MRRPETGAWRLKSFDILRELVYGPKTCAQIAERCGMSKKSVHRTLPIAAAAGLVWIEKSSVGDGWKPFVYHFCHKPFEKPDTVKQ